MDVNTVTEHIDTNILHSRLYDSASDKDKQKAVNNAENVLLTHLKSVYKDEVVPVEDVAEQALFLLRMDDTFQRAEMGVLGITVDGVYIQLAEMDRTVSPSLLKKHGVSNIKKQRVGSYTSSVHDTYKMGLITDR